MFENNLDYAVAYYQAMSDKNISFMEKCIHPDIQFTGPFAATVGKDVIISAYCRNS